MLDANDFIRLLSSSKFFIERFDKKTGDRVFFDTEPFVRSYAVLFELLIEYSHISSVVKLISYIALSLDRDSLTVDIDPSSLCSDFGYKRHDMIYSAIKVLVERNVIKKVKKTQYVINPLVFYNGDRRKIVKGYEMNEMKNEFYNVQQNKIQENNEEETNNLDW